MFLRDLYPHTRQESNLQFQKESSQPATRLEPDPFEYLMCVHTCLLS